MRKILFIVSFLILSVSTQAQEINATITLDAEQTGQNNLQVFRTLEQQLTEFINNTNWTDKVYKNQERIDCNFTLIISDYDGTSFSGSLQIQASRPVYGSTYDSPIYNYNDRQVSFNYKEFEPLDFNLNNFESNLISVIAYHVFTVIGLDGTQSRYRYNDALLSNVYAEFHEGMYQYHRMGLDTMILDQKEAKANIMAAIATLKSINDRRPNSYLLRTFFDAKSDEIQTIFSGGPQVNIATLIENLNRMAPTKRSNWSKIKF